METEPSRSPEEQEHFIQMFGVSLDDLAAQGTVWVPKMSSVHLNRTFVDTPGTTKLGHGAGIRRLGNEHPGHWVCISRIGSARKPL